MIHTLANIDDQPTALRSESLSHTHVFFQYAWLCMCCAARFPRGSCYGDLVMPAEPRFLEPGRGWGPSQQTCRAQQGAAEHRSSAWKVVPHVSRNGFPPRRICREGRDGKLAILSIGGRLRECLKACELCFESCFVLQVRRWRGCR